MRTSLPSMVGDGNAKHIRCGRQPKRGSKTNLVLRIGAKSHPECEEESSKLKFLTDRLPHGKPGFAPEAFATQRHILYEGLIYESTTWERPNTRQKQWHEVYLPPGVYESQIGIEYDASEDVA